MGRCVLFYGICFSFNLIVSYSAGGSFKIFPLISAVLTCIIGFLGSRPQFRVRAQAFFVARGGKVNTAVCIASLLGNYETQEVSTKSKELFRYITLPRMAWDNFQDALPDKTLFALSSHGRFGDVDVFLSHSWSDVPKVKWAALHAWRDDFLRKNHYEPKIWIDKWCIEQAQLDVSLMCLPVFVTGCQRLLVLAGKTYARDFGV